MSSTFALVRLYDAVVARFVTDGAGPESPTVVTQSFGWREVAKHRLEAGRIVWMPGDPNGALGTFSGAKGASRIDARSLATLGELFTVTVSAVDTTDRTNEVAQYTATRALMDAWYRAVYLASRGTFTVVSGEWIKGRAEWGYGMALRLTCTVEAAVLDAPFTAAPTDTKAVVTSTLAATDVAVGTNDEAPEQIEAVP
jgi:hypothetical protein